MCFVVKGNTFFSAWKELKNEHVEKKVGYDGIWFPTPVVILYLWRHLRKGAILRDKFVGHDQTPHIIRGILSGLTILNFNIFVAPFAGLIRNTITNVTSSANKNLIAEHISYALIRRRA